MVQLAANLQRRQDVEKLAMKLSKLQRSLKELKTKHIGNDILPAGMFDLVADRLIVHLDERHVE